MVTFPAVQSTATVPRPVLIFIRTKGISEAESAKWLVTYRGCIPVNGHAFQTFSTNRGLCV